MSLRIAMVTTFYPPYNFGGDGRYVQRLSHALARRGVEVEVIHDVDAYTTLSGSKTLEQPESEPAGVTVHRLKSRWGAISSLCTHQLGRPVIHGHEISKILKNRFDVIHYHNISLIGGPEILKYGDGLKLYTPHEHWLVCPNHTLWRHNRELCDKRECFKCVKTYRRPPQLWRMTDLLEQSAENVDAFLALTQSCADNHAKVGFTRKMQVMPSFLPDADRSEAEPAQDMVASEKPYFLYVGRLEVLKGLQDIIPTFREQEAAELWICGEGDHEPELRNLAQGHPNIRFLGQRSSAQLNHLYKNARALIVPSLCYEVFPLVVLEAFRAGTPVIARDLGPFPEIIDQSNGGLLFRTQSDLKAAIERLLSYDLLRHKLGRAARAAFDERWSESVAMTNYFQAIKNIAQTNKREGLLSKLSGMNIVPADTPAAARTSLSPFFEAEIREQT